MNVPPCRSARPGEPTPAISDTHRGPTGVLEVRHAAARSNSWRDCDPTALDIAHIDDSAAPSCCQRMRRALHHPAAWPVRIAPSAIAATPTCHVPQIPQRFLMGPGPANADPRILAAQSLPLLGHM